MAWCGYEWRVVSTTKITVLPTGGGTAVYSDLPGRSDDLLIDCGRSNSVQSLVKPFLRAQGVNHLPALLLTHGDVRHVGGAELVAEVFPVSRVCASGVRSRSPAYRRILADFEQVPGKIKTICRNEPLAGWTALHPDPSDHFPRADDNAVVLWHDFGSGRVLLLSDLGRLGQEALLERNPNLQADIVVTGLPAGSEPVSDGLLDVIKPRVIIVTDSEFPARERAPPKLQERLAKRNIPIIFTRSAGAVMIELRRRHWEVRTMSGIRIQN
jgi:competence protein ComEC